MNVRVWLFPEYIDVWSDEGREPEGAPNSL